MTTTSCELVSLDRLDYLDNMLSYKSKFSDKELKRFLRIEYKINRPESDFMRARYDNRLRLDIIKQILGC